MKATKKAIRVWMLGVMAKQRVSMSVAEVDDQIALATPTFMMRFPAEAYCQASMDAVASEVITWNEARVVAAMEAWWAKENPDKTGLPPQAETAPLDHIGKQWAAFWFRATDDRKAVSALALISTLGSARECYAWLLRTDTAAAAIAVRRGWTDPNRFSAAALATEWADPETVRAAVRSCMGIHANRERTWPTPLQIAQSLGTLRALVERHAPINLSLIPSAETLNGGDYAAHYLDQEDDGPRLFC